MSRWNHCSTLTVLAAMTAATPALAATGPGAKDTQPVVAVTAPAADSSARASQPVLTARAPFTTVWNSTLLSANSQAMGLRSSRTATSNHVQWAIAGAAVGAIVGVIADDPLRDAL